MAADASAVDEKDEKDEKSDRPKLNPKEIAVLLAMPLPEEGVLGKARLPVFASLEAIAKVAFAGRKRGFAPGSKGNSWTRNSMRKPLRLGLVEHEGGKSGRYSLTKAGQALAEAIAEKQVEGLGEKVNAADLRREGDVRE